MFNNEKNLNDEENVVDLKETGLRWVSLGPIVDRDYESEDLESQMDHLIDSHLWYLPIPRFSRSFSLVDIINDTSLGEEQIISTIEHGCKSAKDFNKIDIYAKGDIKGDIKGLENCNSFFVEHFKHISVLRDTSVDTEKLAFVLGLMALDPVLLNKLPLTFYEKSNFINVASEAIKKDIGHSFEDALEMLSAIEKHLHLKNKKHLTTDTKAQTETTPNSKAQNDDKLEQSEIAHFSSWSNFAELKKTGFMSGQLEEFLKNAIKHDSKKLDVSEDVLLKSLRISSVTEEVPDIAYNINSQWYRSTYILQL